MQRLDVSGGVRPLYGSLGFEGLIVHNTLGLCEGSLVITKTSNYGRSQLNRADILTK